MSEDQQITITRLIALGVATNIRPLIIGIWSLVVAVISGTAVVVGYVSEVHHQLRNHATQIEGITDMVREIKNKDIPDVRSEQKALSSITASHTVQIAILAEKSSHGRP